MELSISQASRIYTSVSARAAPSPIPIETQLGSGKGMLGFVLPLAANAPCFVRNAEAAAAILAEADVEFLHVPCDLHRTRRTDRAGWYDFTRVWGIHHWGALSAEWVRAQTCCEHISVRGEPAADLALGRNGHGFNGGRGGNGVMWLISPEALLMLHTWRHAAHL